MATDPQPSAHLAAFTAESAAHAAKDFPEQRIRRVAEAVLAALQPYLREGADPAPDPDYRRVTSQEMLDDLRELREWRQGVRRVAPFSEGADPVPPSREAHILAHISYYTPH